MSAIERCEFLHAGPPACELSYADVLGSKFDVFQALFAVMALAVAAPSVYFTVKLVRARGLFHKLMADGQRRIFYLCTFVSLTLAVRAVDPEGWRRLVPIVVIGLCIDLATAAVFSLVINLVREWSVLTLSVTRRGRMVPCTNRAFAALHAYIWLLLFVTSVLQNTQDDIWFWRAIKLAASAVLLVVLSVVLAAVGVLIWRFLSQNERRLGSRQNSGVALRRSSTASANGADADAAAAAEAGNSRALRGSVAMRTASRSDAGQGGGRSSRRKRSKVNRILKLLVPMLVLAAVTVVVQLQTARQLADDRFTRAKPDEPPSTTGDILAEVSLEILQAVCTLVGVFFFRVRRHRSQGGSESGGSNVSGISRSGRSSRASSTAGFAGRPARVAAPTKTNSEQTLDNAAPPADNAA